MNFNNNNQKQSPFRIGEQDLNPLSGGTGQLPSSSGFGGVGGNQVGPNHPIFNSIIQPPQQQEGKPQQIIPGARFDPVYPNGPMGGVGSGNRGGSSSSTFGNINPDHQKPPQFDDDDLI